MVVGNAFLNVPVRTLLPSTTPLFDLFPPFWNVTLQRPAIYSYALSFFRELNRAFTNGMKRPNRRHPIIAVLYA